MRTTDEIISCVDHRPWSLPPGHWSYYQEWNRTLFLHWRVPASALRPLVPRQLDLDDYSGETWISLVAFTMERIRPRSLPAISYLSNFNEINLRTYVKSERKSGVYFLSIEAGKPMSAYTAKLLSGLPYEQASMSRHHDVVQRYVSRNRKRKFHLDASFEISAEEPAKSDLDLFLTEKYCLYMARLGRLFQYDIHHKPWNLREVTHIDLRVDY